MIEGVASPSVPERHPTRRGGGGSLLGEDGLGAYVTAVASKGKKKKKGA